MPFIDFLYANLELGAPPGMEEEVVPIRAFKGATHVTGYYQFSDEELAEINKTGGLWLSFMGSSWPPVQVNPFVPAHRYDAFKEVQVYGNTMVQAVNSGDLVCLFYLDLALMFLKVPTTQSDFIWRTLPLEECLKYVPDEAGKFDKEGSSRQVYDMEYRDNGSPVHSGGQYLFSEPLQVLGRFKDLPRLQPLDFIYPMLKQEGAGDLLVLAPKDPPKKEPAQPSRIISLN